MEQSKSYVYRFIDKNEKIIYIGKTNNLDRRYKQHFNGYGHLSDSCYKSVWKIEYIKLDNEINALLLETYYINKYRPFYNKLNKTKRPVSLDNINLKEIKDNWKIYRVVNSTFEPVVNYEDIENPIDEKFKKKVDLVFRIISVTACAILLILHFWQKLI